MDKQVKTLNSSMVAKSKCVAFCFHHKFYLTEQGLKTKRCLSKQNKRTGDQICGCLQKLEHDFWIYREQDRREKKRKEEEERKRLQKAYNRAQRVSANKKKFAKPPKTAIVYGEEKETFKLGDILNGTDFILGSTQDQ